MSAQIDPGESYQSCEQQQWRKQKTVLRAEYACHGKSRCRLSGWKGMTVRALQIARKTLQCLK